MEIFPSKEQSFALIACFANTSSFLRVRARRKKAVIYTRNREMC